MTLPAVDSDSVAARLSLIRPHLDERAWRLLLGAEAKVRGRGGIKLVAAAGGVHPDTVAQGVRELDYDEPIPGRVRRPGAGRPAMAVTTPIWSPRRTRWWIRSRAAIRSRRCGGRLNRRRSWPPS